MRCFSKLSAMLFILGLSSTVLAQSTNYNIGRVPSEVEIRQWAIPVGPAGKELPQGSGGAREGAVIYNRSCVSCQGPDGRNGAYSELNGHLRSYATTTWDYIYRSMPRSLTNPGFQERQLSADEVYALTAYILHINGLISADEIMDADSLPKVNIPFAEIQ